MRNKPIEKQDIQDVKEMLKLYLALSRDEKLKAFGFLMGLSSKPAA